MKRLFAACFFFAGISAFAQWTWLQTSTSQLTQRKMTFLNENTGFVVGTNAIPNGNARIARTTNGGTSWTTVCSIAPSETPSTMMMNAIQAVNPNVLYACGGYIDPIPGIIVKSTDGGLTWQQLPHSINASRFIALHFFDASTGLIAGPGLWRTTDGGTTWTEIELPAGVTALYDLYFTSPTTGFAVEYETDGLLKTVDGGLTWSTVSIPTTENTYAIAFNGTTHGLIGCGNGVILYTNNGGATWSVGSNADPDMSQVTCVAMTSAMVGYAGTIDGRILHTVNGGATWTVGVNVPSLNAALFLASIYDIDFPTPSTGFASGLLMGTLVKTSNGGGVVGLEEIVQEPLRMAPNPATSYIRFDARDVSSVQILTTDGRLVKSVQQPRFDDQLSIEDLPQGAYVLRAIGQDQVRKGLFIKE